jgi:hypothetical protein
MIFLQNKTLKEKINIVHIYNNKLDTTNNNCIYGLNNKLFENIIKIGSTKRPEFRKYDYHTSSPFPFYYDWIIYLDNFNCYLFDDIIKYELEDYRIKENGSIEFYLYNINETSICKILEKYKISYKLELGDPFVTKPLNYINNYNKIDLNIYKKKILQMNSKLIQLENLLNDMNIDELKDARSLLDINITTDKTQNTFNEDFDYSYMDSKISNIDFDIIKSNIKCQSIKFIYDKMRNSNKINRKSLILGDIQSGKTNEIIQLSYFICKYLKIPTIIMLQNKKAGITQLVVRIDQFNSLLERQKIDFKLKYKITSNRDITKDKLIKLFHPKNPLGEIIICLCNPKQLNKIQNSIILCKEKYRKVSPFVCLIDEYDDLIKSRHDISESNKNKKKQTELPALFLQQKSYLSIGITATLLAPMMQEDKLTKNDIFKLKTSEDYVGYNSYDRLSIEDISDYIIRSKGKKNTQINNNSISYIINLINNSINNTKNYSITLLNVTDKKEEHKQYSEDICNEFPDWAIIRFHSNEDNKILCELPEINNISKEDEIRFEDNKVITIKLHKYKIPEYKLRYINIKCDEDKYYNKYSINFENMSIQEVITKLLEYTNKICIISGRMATRGISFVNNDYSKHITDLIYVPSDASHVTRNVQDMRIFGNFKKDDIVLTLYVDATMYKDNIERYNLLQNEIINNILSDNDKSIKESLMSKPINVNLIPSKKLDRIGLTKGFNFNTNKWGIPLDTDNYDEALNLLKTKYKFLPSEIIKYSEYISIDIDEPFISSQRKFGIIKQNINEIDLENKYSKSIGRIPIKINNNIDINNEKVIQKYINKQTGWNISNIKIYKPTTENMNRKLGINTAIEKKTPYNYADRCDSNSAMIIKYDDESYYHVVSIEKHKKYPDDEDIIDDIDLNNKYKDIICKKLNNNYNLKDIKYISCNYGIEPLLYDPFYLKKFTCNIPLILYSCNEGSKKINIIKHFKHLNIFGPQKKIIFYSKKGYHYSEQNNNMYLLDDKFLLNK